MTAHDPGPKPSPSPVTRTDALLIAKELQVELSSESRTLYFHGESMRPFLVEGDEVVVEPVAYRRIRIGDVITYRFQDKFPTRRVVRKRRTGLDLWCENWPTQGFWAPREDVLGRAVARRRDGAWVTCWDSEWKSARRKALRAHFSGRIRPCLVDLPRRVVAKVKRTLGRARSG